MDLIIVFGNLDGSRSLRRFTCLTTLEWAQSSLAKDGDKATTMLIIAQKVLLKVTSNLRGATLPIFFCQKNESSSVKVSSREKMHGKC